MSYTITLNENQRKIVGKSLTTLIKCETQLVSTLTNSQFAELQKLRKLVRSLTKDPTSLKDVVSNEVEKTLQAYADEGYDISDVDVKSLIRDVEKEYRPVYMIIESLDPTLYGMNVWS